MSIKNLRSMVTKRKILLSFVAIFFLFFCIAALTKVNALTVTLQQGSGVTRSSPYSGNVCSEDTWDIMLVIDNSNSMNGQKLVDAKNAAISFVNLVLQNPKSRVGIATFDNNGNLKSEITNSANTLTATINGIQSGGAGGTCLECALRAKGGQDVYGAFSRGGQDIFGILTGGAPNKRMVIILTDGRINRWEQPDGTIKGSTNAGDEQTARDQARGAAGDLSRDKGAVFWVVHYGTGQSHASYLRDEIVGSFNGTGKYLPAPTSDQFYARYQEIANTILGRRIIARVFKGTSYTLFSKLSGVKVRLQQPSVAGSGKEGTTDAGGTVYFTNLCASNFTLSVVAPAGYKFLNPASGSYAINGLGSGATAVRDFGLQTVPLPPTTGTIAGCVYNDANGDGKIIGDSLTTGVVAKVSGTSAIVGSGVTPGCFQFRNVLYNNFNLTLSDLPTGYTTTYPTNLGKYLGSINATSDCNISPNDGSILCNSGTISPANFAITTTTGSGTNPPPGPGPGTGPGPGPGTGPTIISEPWIRTYGLDIRIDNDINDPIPSTACQGPYASLQSTGSVLTPGIMVSGSDATINFAPGSASAPTWGWTVKSTYSSPNKKPLPTSYSQVLANAKKSVGGTKELIGADGSCINPILCTPTGSLASGTYTVEGNLTLTGAWTIPDDKNYVILVKGTVNIVNNAVIRIGGNNSSLTIVASEDIIVDPSVGLAQPFTAASCGAQATLDGFYSADDDFIIKSTNNCVTEKMLNMSGSIVMNAELGTGELQNERGVGCSFNTTYPTFTIRARPDLILNTSEVIKTRNLEYREVAP